MGHGEEKTNFYNANVGPTVAIIEETSSSQLGSSRTTSSPKENCTPLLSSIFKRPHINKQMFLLCKYNASIIETLWNQWRHFIATMNQMEKINKEMNMIFGHEILLSCMYTLWYWQNKSGEPNLHDQLSVAHLKYQSQIKIGYSNNSSFQWLSGDKNPTKFGISYGRNSKISLLKCVCVCACVRACV